MNYIKEINSFYDWLETNSISDSAIVLWHALMHINNKAGWITEFAVAISTLSTKTGLKKDAIVRARLRLQQSGRIDFKSRSGQQSAIYTIIPFESENQSCVGLSDTNRNTNREQTATQTATQTASIIKLNKTKLNETVVVDNSKDSEVTKTDFGSLYNIYLKFFTQSGESNEFDAQELGYLYDDYSGEWLLEALREAHRHRIYTLAYLEAILREWKKEGVVRPKLNKKSVLREPEEGEMVMPPDILGEE